MTTFHEKEKKWREKNPLRIFRKRYGLQQQTIAAAMNTSYHAIYRMEGGLSEPDEDQYKVLAKIINDPELRGKWIGWLKDRPIFKGGKQEGDSDGGCSK